MPRQCVEMAAATIWSSRPGSRPRPLPQRGRRPQVHLHGADEPGPDGEGPQEVDHALEGTPERVPDRLRGPPDPEQQLTTQQPSQPGLRTPGRREMIFGRGWAVSPFDLALGARNQVWSR